MIYYNVLWFDDKHDTFETFKDDAHVNGIKLMCFTNAEEGLIELENNLLAYDAVIVDGLFYSNPNQSGDTVNDTAFGKVALFLEKVADRKKIPWFILSGQTKFINEDNALARLFKENKVYNKNFKEDLDQLLNDVKIEADNQIDTQIKQRYFKVFEVCSKKYIGNAAIRDLLSILKKEREIETFQDTDIYFNQLRKVMEDLFIAFNKYKLLPDVFIKPSVALNESSRFLAGSIEKGYQLDLAIFIKVIADHVKNILSVCQPGSHRSEIELFVSNIKSPYLLLSITYQLLDVLLWFKMYVDSNDNLDLNIKRCKQIEASIESGIFEGIIEKDNKGNYHCEQIILTYKDITANGYKIGDKIRILKTAINTNEKNKDFYPKFAISSERI